MVLLDRHLTSPAERPLQAHRERPLQAHRSRFARCGALVASLLATACGGSDDDAAEGAVTVSAYGESFIEEGIPASEVADGWAVEFTRFVVEVADVRVAGTDIPVESRVDLTFASRGAGHELGSAAVASGDHTGSSFTLTRVEIEGSAQRGTEVKQFNWVFEQPTRYEACEATTTVPDGGTAGFQITVHADHLFYDSLVAEEPQLLVQPLADADADDDGAITQAELAATDIGAYDAGSEDGIDDLWAWLTAQSRTLGHADGEAHCQVAPAG